MRVSSALVAIDIQKPHDKGLDEAKRLADVLAQDLSKRFDMQYSWHGDRLHFKRVGIDGSIDVGSDHIRVSAQLSPLFRHLEPVVADKISDYLDRKLDSTHTQ